MRENFFIFFGIFTMLSAVGVVFSRSAVYSAFSLILSFFGLSAIYVMWGTTFLAMIQILVYAGAIVVLFVFVVMLLNLTKGIGPHTQNWLTIIVAGTGVWFFSLFLLRSLNHLGEGGTTTFAMTDDIRKVSLMLFNEYLWPFEVLSLFLLALIIAIYAMARPESPEEGKV